MYCPSCSTQAADGAKFCKSCGLSLSIITQALNGDSGFSDPLRDREYKRARKQISEGIQGTSVGAAFLVAAGLAYACLPIERTIFQVPALIAALVGLVYVFRNIGKLIDAKVGRKMVQGPVQPRGTGALGSGAATIAFQSEKPGSASLNQAAGRSVFQDRAQGEAALSKRALPVPSVDPARPAPTGRINREQSSPLRRDKKNDDLLAKIRN